MVVYGIDLGTCYSCIARDDGAGMVMPVELLLNGGKKFVPSIVTFDRTGQPKVGDSGKAGLTISPERTKAFVKREMDREFCKEMVLVANKERKISPVEVSACILKYLFDGANKVETGGGRNPVTHAVITVPAKFDERQRARTKLAAQMAGIQVLGLLNEPTAAAIGSGNGVLAGRTALVFDLGGGTLDVSIVTNDKGNYKVIGTPAGDEHLGGLDWDERLVRLAFRKARKELGTPDAKTWSLLMSRAEKIKLALTESDVIIDDDVYEGNIIADAEVEIRRSEFESMCQDLLDRCWAVVDKAIANAKAMSPELKIDYFLTVGGSSKMPMIKKGIIERYGSTYGKGKAEKDWLHIEEPDIAIAKGAAIYAQMLSKGLSTLEDRATHSYGLFILKDDKDVIMNLVRSTDPIVYQQEYDDLCLSESTDQVIVRVYENDSTEQFAEIADSRVIFDRYFMLNGRKEKGTSVGLRINRDQDGLITIHLSCGNQHESFEVNSAEQLIDAETKKNIEHSLKLMK